MIKKEGMEIVTWAVKLKGVKFLLSLPKNTRLGF